MKEVYNPEDGYASKKKKVKRDLRGIYDTNPRFCKVCKKRLHAKQDKYCSRQCLAKGRD